MSRCVGNYSTSILKKLFRDDSTGGETLPPFSDWLHPPTDSWSAVGGSNGNFFYNNDFWDENWDSVSIKRIKFTDEDPYKDARAVVDFGDFIVVGPELSGDRKRASLYVLSGDNYENQVRYSVDLKEGMDQFLHLGSSISAEFEGMVIMETGETSSGEDVLNMVHINAFSGAVTRYPIETRGRGFGYWTSPISWGNYVIVVEAHEAVVMEYTGHGFTEHSRHTWTGGTADPNITEGGYGLELILGYTKDTLYISDWDMIRDFRNNQRLRAINLSDFTLRWDVNVDSTLNGKYTEDEYEWSNAATPRIGVLPNGNAVALTFSELKRGYFSKYTTYNVIEISKDSGEVVNTWEYFDDETRDGTDIMMVDKEGRVYITGWSEHVVVLDTRTGEFTVPLYSDYETDFAYPAPMRDKNDYIIIPHDARAYSYETYQYVDKGFIHVLKDGTHLTSIELPYSLPFTFEYANFIIKGNTILYPDNNRDGELVELRFTSSVV